VSEIREKRRNNTSTNEKGGESTEIKQGNVIKIQNEEPKSPEQKKAQQGGGCKC